MNIFKAETQNKTGKTLFYIFEICALIVGFLSLVMAIYYAATYESFMAFVSYLIPAIVDTVVVFGIGKLVDLLYCKKECKKAEKTEEQNNND